MKRLIVVAVLVLIATSTCWTQDKSSYHPDIKWLGGIDSIDTGEQFIANLALYHKEGDTIFLRMDTFYIKVCRIDTVGWEAETCEYYYSWHSSSDMYTWEGDSVIVCYSPDILFYKRKAKPNLIWKVKTEEHCWFEPIKKVHQEIDTTKVK